MPANEMISVANIGLMVDFEDQTAAYGTAKGSPTGHILAFDASGLKPGQQGIENREFTGSRVRQALVPGNKGLTGRFSHKATIDTLPWMWKAILGPVTTVANAGSGAVAGTVTLSGGAVATVPVTTPGTLYAIPPRVSFSGGGGSGAEAYAVVSSGGVASVVVTKGGSGYTSPPTATFTVNNLHTIDVADPPTFCVQHRKPFSTPTYDLFKGCRMASGSMKFGGTGYYMFETDIMGGSVSTSTSNYDGSAVDWRAGKKLHHGLLPITEVKVDGAAVTYGRFLELTINFNNNLDGEDYPMGFQGSRAGLTPDDFETKFSGTLRVQSQADLDLFADSTMPDHALGLKWIFTDPAYFHTLTLPAVQFDPTGAAPDQRGGYKMPFTGTAHGDSSSKQLTVTISNAQAAAAYA